MKTNTIISAVAAAFLLFAAAPMVNAQRGAMQQSQRPSGSGHDTRGAHSGGGSAPQMSSGRQGGGNQQAGPRNNGGNGGRQMGSANGRPMGQGGNPVRRAEGGHAFNGGPRNNGGPAGGGPRQFGGAAPRHNAGPAAGGPRHAGPAAPRHNAGPAVGGPRHFAGPAPVAGPRHNPGPVGGPRVFAPRPMHHGPAPVYHRAIDRRARVFYIDETPYYSWGGVYYRYVPSYGYEEIAMPEDVVVTELPYGASCVYVNNIGYYEADGMWFQPVTGGYLIVDRPVAHVTVAVPRPHVSFHASFGF